MGMLGRSGWMVGALFAALAGGTLARAASYTIDASYTSEREGVIIATDTQTVTWNAQQLVASDTVTIAEGWTLVIGFDVSGTTNPWPTSSTWIKGSGTLRLTRGTPTAANNGFIARAFSPTDGQKFAGTLELASGVTLNMTEGRGGKMGKISAIVVESGATMKFSGNIGTDGDNPLQSVRISIAGTGASEQGGALVFSGANSTLGANVSLAGDATVNVTATPNDDKALKGTWSCNGHTLTKTGSNTLKFSSAGGIDVGEGTLAITGGDIIGTVTFAEREAEQRVPVNSTDGQIRTISANWAIPEGATVILDRASQNWGEMKYTGALSGAGSLILRARTGDDGGNENKWTGTVTLTGSASGFTGTLRPDNMKGDTTTATDGGNTQFNITANGNTYGGATIDLSKRTADYRWLHLSTALTAAGLMDGDATSTSRVTSSSADNVLTLGGAEDYTYAGKLGAGKYRGGDNTNEATQASAPLSVRKVGEGMQTFSGATQAFGTIAVEAGVLDASAATTQTIAQGVTVSGTGQLKLATVDLSGKWIDLVDFTFTEGGAAPIVGTLTVDEHTILRLPEGFTSGKICESALTGSFAPANVYVGDVPLIGGSFTFDPDSGTFSAEASTRQTWTPTAESAEWSNTSLWSPNQEVPTSGDIMIDYHALTEPTSVAIPSGTFTSVSFIGDTAATSELRVTLAEGVELGALTIAGHVELPVAAVNGNNADIALEHGWRLAVRADEAATLTRGIAGDGTFEKRGAGTLTLGANVAPQGGSTVAEGTLCFGDGVISNKAAANNGGTYSTAGDVRVKAGATLDINGTADAWLNTVTLEAGATYANNGENNVDNGSRQLRNLTLEGDATIAATGNLGLVANAHAATTLTLNGHTLTKTGAGTLWFVQTATTNGTLDVQGGKIQTAQNKANAFTGPMTFRSDLDDAFDFANGTVPFTGAFTKEGTGTMTYPGTISGTGGLTVAGGKLKLTDSTRTRSAKNASNTTVVETGATLELAEGFKLYESGTDKYGSVARVTIRGHLITPTWVYGTAFGDLGHNSGYVTLDGGKVTFTGNCGSASDSATRGFTVTAKGATLEVPEDVTYYKSNVADAYITNNGTLTLTGGGTFTLDQKRTTTNNTIDIGGMVKVTEGTTLSGTGTLSGTLSLEAGATLDASAGALTVSGSTTLPEEGTVTVRVAENAAPGTVVLTAPNVNAQRFALAEGAPEGRLLAASADALRVVATPPETTGDVAQILADAAAQANVWEITAVTAEGKASVEGAALFDGVVTVTPSMSQDGTGTATVAYDFGIQSLTIREEGDVLYVVLAAKVQGAEEGQADYAEGTDVKIYRVEGEGEAETLEEIEVQEPVTPLPNVSETGVKWIRFPYAQLEGTGTFRLKVKAAKAATP